MSEIRKLYFISEYWIIAEERAKRLSDFANTVEKFEKDSPEIASFGGTEEIPHALQNIKIGKFLQILARKEHATGIFAAFRTSTLHFFLSLVLQNIKRIACKLSPGMAFMKLS